MIKIRFISSGNESSDYREWTGPIPRNSETLVFDDQSGFTSKYILPWEEYIVRDVHYTILKAKDGVSESAITVHVVKA